MLRLARLRNSSNSRRKNAVRSAVRLAGYELKGVDVVIDLPQDSHVLGDEPAIIGVLVNLLGNAGLALRKAQPRPSPTECNNTVAVNMPASTSNALELPASSSPCASP